MNINKKSEYKLNFFHNFVATSYISLNSVKVLLEKECISILERCEDIFWVIIVGGFLQSCS